MKTSAMAAAEAAQKQFYEHHYGDRCHCGHYKWAGFLFCFPCQERLPAAERRNLYGKSGDALAGAYAQAKQWLREQDTEDGLLTAAGEKPQ